MTRLEFACFVPFFLGLAMKGISYTYLCVGASGVCGWLASLKIWDANALDLV